MINDLMEEHNLQLPRVSKKIKGEAGKALMGVSLVGRQATILLKHFEEFLVMLLPEGKTTTPEHERSLTAYRAYLDLWNVLAVPFDASDPLARGKKSKDVGKLGKAFVMAFMLAGHSKAVTFYMRLLYCEMPPLDNEVPSGRSLGLWHGWRAGTCA